MKQIFLFGASGVYGVGGNDGGWGDILKRQLHQRMFAEGGMGEIAHVYNFGKSGAVTQFVIDNFESQIDQYALPGDDVIIVLSMGRNDSKAKNDPTNYVSTLEDYGCTMRVLIEAMQSRASRLIVVGATPVDESKTAPKADPISGGTSYFYNERIRQFDDALRVLCDELGITYVKFDIDEQDWIANYLWQDGLHPNNKGYQYICDKVMDVIEN
jgi:lysophospholipase L1-like esterase